MCLHGMFKLTHEKDNQVITWKVLLKAHEIQFKLHVNGFVNVHIYETKSLPKAMSCHAN